jgi:FkbM family methyltransferase
MRVLTRYLIQHAQLSITNKQRLYNFFAGDTAPDKPVTFSCAITNPDSATLNLELDIRDDLSSKWYYWGYTNYELGTVRLFAELLKTKRCIFDVGANIGFYTLLAACAIKDRGEVHAFEPHPEVFQWIAYNSDLNGFSALRLNQVALSDVDGEVPLFMPADSSAWTNASLVEGFMSQQDPIEINAVRFDTYCSKHLHVPVDLLKVDVEGAELKVFHGMGCLLDEWQPDIICEVLAPYENDLDVFFSDKPYRKFLITDDGLIEVERIKAHPQFRDFYLSVAPAELGRV